MEKEENQKTENNSENEFGNGSIPYLMSLKVKLKKKVQLKKQKNHLKKKY